MTGLYDLYETDLDLEKEGVWVEITADIKVKIAALGNKNHQEAIEKFAKPYKSQIRHKTISVEVEEDLHLKAIAKAVLVDWEGMTDREGKALPYSFDNCYALLSDPKMKRFKADILLIAKEAETFKNVEVEDAVKN